MSNRQVYDGEAKALVIREILAFIKTEGAKPNFKKEYQTRRTALSRARTEFKKLNPNLDIGTFNQVTPAAAAVTETLRGTRQWGGVRIVCSASLALTTSGSGYLLTTLGSTGVTVPPPSACNCPRSENSGLCARTCQQAIVGATCIRTLRSPTLHKDQSDQFIQDTYPIADAQVTGQLSALSTVSSFPGQLGVEWDIVNVALSRTLQNLNARNGVGIVPSDSQGSPYAGYFSYHYPGQGIHGASYTPSSYGLPFPTSLFVYASLVEEGWWPVTAHEIAHTFGVPDATASNIYSGYNVRLTTPVPINNSSHNLVSDFMGSFVINSYFQDPASAWITPSTYSTILSDDYGNASDPEVLLLSGLIMQNGSVQMNPSFFLPNGFSGPYSAAANGQITALDSTGSAISQVSFLDSSQLQLSTDSGQMFPVTESPFVVQIPFSQEVETVQITQSGKVISKFSPSSQLLVDTVKQISPSSFEKNAALTEKLLLLQAEAIQSVLNTCSNIMTDKSHENWLKIVCTDSAEQLSFESRG